MTETLLSCVCVVLGVVISLTSMTTTPLSGLADRPTVVLLSIALGRFVFTFAHLVGYPGLDLAWTLFRVIYVAVSVICLTVVLLTGDLLLVAVSIVLLELGMAVEEASTVVERTAAVDSCAVASAARDRLERVLTLLGLVAVSVVVPVPLVLLVVSVCSLQSSFVLGPPEFGVLCFAVLFYSLTAAFLFFFRRLRYRCRLTVPSLPKFPGSSGGTILSSREVQVRRQSPVRAVSTDRKHRRAISRADVAFLLHGVRGMRVRGVDVFNAVRIAAATARGLPSSHRSQLNRHRRLR